MTVNRFQKSLLVNAVISGLTGIALIFLKNRQNYFEG